MHELKTSDFMNDLSAMDVYWQYCVSSFLGFLKYLCFLCSGQFNILQCFCGHVYFRCDCLIYLLFYYLYFYCRGGQLLAGHRRHFAGEEQNSVSWPLVTSLTFPLPPARATSEAPITDGATPWRQLTTSGLAPVAPVFHRFTYFNIRFIAHFCCDILPTLWSW